MTLDKGGISALRLAQMLGVQWRTAQLMLNKLRRAMTDRDLDYWVQGTAEVDDGYFGGTRPGKRGRGTEGRRPVLVEVECRADGSAGFAALKARGGSSLRRVAGIRRARRKPSARPAD